MPRGVCLEGINHLPKKGLFFFLYNRGRSPNSPPRHTPSDIPLRPLQPLRPTIMQNKLLPRLEWCWVPFSRSSPVAFSLLCLPHHCDRFPMPEKAQSSNPPFLSH